MDYTQSLRAVERVEKKCGERFARIDATALFNQNKVLEAFQNNRIAVRHFAGTTGYGYDDIGRAALNGVMSDIFRAEDAIVSPMLASGTHALSTALFGILRPGDTVLSVSGAPYDTLMPVILGEGNGSLKDFGVKYSAVELLAGEPDYDGIERAVKEQRPKLVYIQRSKGYNWRRSLVVDDIQKVVAAVKSLYPQCLVMVDNCYGEMVETREPIEAGADIAVGSMIKNMGGGLCPTGGYIAGTKACVDLIAQRLTAPGIGGEVGSYAYGYQSFFQGIFLSPHVTAQALKSAVLFSSFYASQFGLETLPEDNLPLGDIVASIKFGQKEKLVKFCQVIQSVSPVDSYVTPEPWAMPGYEDDVIMAAGTFVGGASIELSCDSPIKPPYIAYLQGGLTYEHAKLALIRSLMD